MQSAAKSKWKQVDSIHNCYPASWNWEKSKGISPSLYVSQKEKGNGFVFTTEDSQSHRITDSGAKYVWLSTMLVNFALISKQACAKWLSSIGHHLLSGHILVASVSDFPPSWPTTFLTSQLKCYQDAEGSMHWICHTKRQRGLRK